MPRLTLAAATVAVALTLAPAALANTLTVTTTNDSGMNSLRAKVAAAGPGDTVYLPASASPYTVTAGEIPITTNITIAGAGSSASVIDANNLSRVFHVTTAPAASTVRLEKLTITGGRPAPGAGPGGGAILVDFGSASLAVVDAVLEHNSVVDVGGESIGGGAIYNAGGDTTLVRSSVRDNSVTLSNTADCCDGGGGIFSTDTGGKVSVTNGSHVDRNSVDITGPTVDGTSCCQGGGGIYQETTDGVLISRSTVSGNHVTVDSADGFHGGGGVLLSPGAAVSVDVVASAMDSNTVEVTGPSADDDAHCCSGGGAVYSLHGVSLSGSLLTRNTATVSAGGFGHGGGAVNIRPSISGVGPPTITIGTTTLARNTAAVTGSGCCNGGGAVQYNGSDGPMTVARSLIASNRATISGSTLSGGGGVYEDTAASNGYVNTTITGNTTNAANPKQGGGGIYLLNAGPVQTTLANVTLASNSAPAGSGGGVLSASNVLQTANSIVALNSAAVAPNCGGFVAQGAIQPAFTSFGHNLTSGTPSCGFTKPTDKTVAPTAVRLGPLKPNGGPTQTRALLAGSPAIDGGAPAGCKNLAGQTLKVDQRGAVRPRDGDGDLIAVCDIGAFEAATKRPRCTLKPKSRKVGRTKRARFRLTARCNEAAAVSLTGKVRIKRPKRKAKTLKLRRARANLKRNVARVLRLKVPKAVRKALARRRRVSASFVLTAKNANGSARATTRIAKVRRAKR